jgi:hypothetical protein
MCMCYAYIRKDYVCLLSSDTSTQAYDHLYKFALRNVLLMRRCDRVLVLKRASIVTSQTKDRIIIMATPQGGTA